MKKIAIAASAVCLITLGAFAGGKFFAPTATAYYKSGNANGCVQITSALNSFDAKGTSTQAAIVDQAGIQRLVYLDATCTTAAKFIP